MPDEDDLADATLLEGRAVAFHGGELLWRLLGELYESSRDLPGVADGETMCTMQILAVDDGFAWAGNRRGFYRLGEPRA